MKLQVATIDPSDFVKGMKAIFHPCPKYMAMDWLCEGSKWFLFESLSFSESLNLWCTFERIETEIMDFTDEMKSYSSIRNSYLEKMLSNLLSKITDYFKHIWSEVIGSIVSQIIVEWEVLLGRENYPGYLVRIDRDKSVQPKTMRRSGGCFRKSELQGRRCWRRAKLFRFCDQSGMCTTLAPATDLLTST